MADPSGPGQSQGIQTWRRRAQPDAGGAIGPTQDGDEGGWTAHLAESSFITAFGNDFKAGPKANGVLLLNGEEETRKIVEGFLAAQDLQDTKGSIKKLQQDPFVL